MRKKKLQTCCVCGDEHTRYRDKDHNHFADRCLKCHAAYMREHRPKHSDLTPLQRRKANARAYANVYLKRGKITKEDCVDCDSEASEMHHENYDKPLEVLWLCKLCHRKRHI